MSKLKKWIGSMAMAMTIFGSGTAHAGIPVVDIPALISLVQQVLSWVEQYGQMVEELEQLEAQYDQAVKEYDSLTGSRGLGSLLNNSALRQVVPNDLAETYSSVLTEGYDGLSGPAKSMRDSSKVYNCENIDGASKTTCEALLSTNAQERSDINTALDWTKQRGDNVEGLQGQINATDDPKAIAELQARIDVENAQIANDANRIALMQANAGAAQRAAEQRSREESIDRVVNGSRTFGGGFAFD